MNEITTIDQIKAIPPSRVLRDIRAVRREKNKVTVHATPTSELLGRRVSPEEKATVIDLRVETVREWLKAHCRYGFCLSKETSIINFMSEEDAALFYLRFA